MRYLLQKKSRSVLYRVINDPLMILQFHFDDIGENGRAPIQITPLPAEEIRKEAQKTIDATPSSVDYEYNMACHGGPYHTDECQLGQDHGLSCIQDRLFEASTRLSGYRSRHWLKECLQKPERAQARQFLEQGLLQKSFVYQHGDVRITPYPLLGTCVSDQVTGCCIAD
jgi:hypothetical protein